ncbi:MAG: magnesium transporter [Clostridiales bacterium]|nr:magnesium transporter [Clostridiales bacterium]
MENFENLRQLLDEKKYTSLMHELDKLYPADAAEFLSRLPLSQQPAVFRMLKKDTAAEIFAELDNDDKERIIAALTDSELNQITEELFTDDVVDMLEELPANVVKRVLQNVSPETRATINRFLAYPEGSAGSIMTSEYATLKGEMTVNEAIAHIRKTGYDKETIYTLYVIDNGRKLIGMLELSDLLFGDPEEKIKNLMDPDPASVLTTDDRETAAMLIAKYDLLALPVVDSEGRLVGIVTVDDALDVLENEATEDIAKMAAVTPADKPYLKTGAISIFKKRIPWLLLLMVSAIFTGRIIMHYENALGLYAILTAFIPMLMDTGGNAGSQASVTIIRSISLGEVEFKNLFPVVWKEIRVSLLCGLVLSAAAFTKALLVDRVPVNIALIVSLTILLVVITSKLVGAVLPLLAKLVRLDPAVMASPLITTIVDALALLIYFGIASAMLGI